MAAQKTVLLIEDDREITQTIRSVLEAKGYRVLHAINGRQGQRVVDSEKPDVIVTDMMMPGEGGFPLLDRLKRRPDSPPVIMITANEGGRHKAYAEMLGVDDYIRKPFAMERLLEGIENALKSGPRKAEFLPPEPKAKRGKDDEDEEE